MKQYIIFVLILWGQGVYAQAHPVNINKKTERVAESIIKVEISVEGMTCQKGCADGIDKALKKLDGVIKSRTLLESGICKVTYDNSIIKIEKIIKIIEERGFKAKVFT